MSNRSTYSSQSTNATRYTPAPDSRPGRTACKAFLYFALPLTLAVGCASGPGRSVATHPFVDFPAPTVVAVSDRQAANTLLGREILDMWAADAELGSYYSMSASIDKEVVTLGGTLPNGAERRRVSARIEELPGVSSVIGKPGELEPIVAIKTVD
jgi:hypothetical protein